MKLQKITLFFVILSLSSIKAFTDFEINLINSVEILANIIHDEFKNKNLNFISTEDNQISEQQEKTKNEIIKKLLKRYPLRIIDNEKGFLLKGKKMFSIMFIKNLTTFENIQKYIDGSTFKSSGFHLIILQNETLNDLHQIFKIMWQKRIFNTYALIKDQTSDGVLFMTINPFEDSQKCGDTSPKLLNKFIDGGFIEKLEIKEKFHNLNLCPIKVSTFSEGVAVFKETQRNGSVIYRGHEIKMIETLANVLNFTIDLDYRDDKGQYGMIYENGTVTGVLGDAQAGKTDIAFGNYFLKASRWKILDISESYLNYPIVFIINDGDKLTAFEKMLQPFSRTVWIFLFITFFIGFLSIYLINKKFKQFKPIFYGEKINTPMMNMLAAILGMQQKKLPKNNFARFILMMFIILCLVLRSIYQGSLYKFLQTDSHHNKIKTIYDLFKNNYTILIYDCDVDLIKDYAAIYEFDVKLKRTEVENTVDEMMSMSKKIAIFASEIIFIEYSRFHRTFPYKIINQNFITINIVMYYQKDFYLKEAIDSKLQQIISAGLIKFWLKEFDHRDEWKVKFLEPMKLTIDHLEGAFLLMIIGHLLACFIFIIEKFLNQ